METIGASSYVAHVLIYDLERMIHNLELLRLIVDALSEHL